jgi:YHS domain-containing protein/Sec-independent protein translocase protein TatA
MIRKTWLSVLTGAVFVLGTAALAGAHEKTGKATGDMMKECGQHHSAAMKASEQVSVHLAEAKRSTTLAQMRTHVEAADKAMAEMKDHMHTCMEMMGEMHGDKMGAGMMGTNATAAKVVDPVSGMEVETANAPKATHKGQTYYFCSEDDQAKFVKNPEQYAEKKP